MEKARCRQRRASENEVCDECWKLHHLVHGARATDRFLRDESFRNLTMPARLPNPLSCETVDAVLSFRDKRGWARFHNSKDLALSLSIEAAELLECFQWSGTDLEVEQRRNDMAEELADVMIYGVLLADRLGLRLDDIVRQKLARNEERYPAEACRRAGGEGASLECYAALKAQGRARAARNTEKRR